MTYIIVFFVQLSLSLLTENVNLDKESNLYHRQTKDDPDDPCYCVVRITNDGVITSLRSSSNSDYSFSPPETCQNITITGISYSAGASRNYRKVDLSQTQITFIEMYSFSNCNSLSVLILPNTLKTMGLDAFRASIITELHIPASLESFDGAFNSCSKLATFTIDSQNPYLRVESNIVFSKNYSKIFRASVNIRQTEDIPHHDQVTELAQYSFSATKIRKYRGTHNLLYIGRGAFELCLELFEVILIDTQVKVIKTYCFYSCSNIDYLLLPQQLEVIESSNFYTCLLTFIIIPSSIKQISSSFYTRQKNLKVYYLGDLYFGSGIFSGYSVEVFVPYSYKYKTFAGREVTACNLDDMYFPKSSNSN